MLENKNILIISPEPWTGIFVSKHHYAIGLARRGNKVFFLNPPSTVKNVQVNEIQQFKRVYVIDYKIYIKGQRFLPVFASRWVDRKIFNEIESKAQCKFDIVWNFENSRFYDFSFLPKNILKIYHQVDLNQNFHPVRAAKTANYVFAVNDSIKDYLSKYNNVFKMPHGFSGYFTKRSLAILSNEVVSYYQHKITKAFYVGNLNSKYLDIELLLELINRNKNVEFNLIGPIEVGSSNYQKLIRLNNINLLGQLSSEEIMNRLDDADVLLLLYQYNKFPEQLSSSHKALEYLASGIVTVSTFMDEYESKDDLILLGKNKSEVLELFEFVINNLKEFNSFNKMKRRIKFAADHTYGNLIDQITTIIEQNPKQSK